MEKYYFSFSPLESGDHLEKKFQMYKKLQSNIPKIIHEAKKLGDKIGIPKNLRGKFSLTGAHSSFPGPISKNVMKAMAQIQSDQVRLEELVDKLRNLVKDIYGDEYDAAPICSGEAALWVAFDVLATSPMLGRGNEYRTRYIAPYERHASHQAGFGRPFPPKYKFLVSDRYVTAGELGVEGKRQYNLDTIIVPLVGARYHAHGIKYFPSPLLSQVDAQGSGERIANVAERHVSSLAAFASLGYDLPGYGYNDKTSNGAPKLQFLIGNLAKEYDLPYITDNAWGIPVVGTDLRKTGASLMLYSVDKVMRGPTSALIIGKEEIMIPIRRALGMHSHRWGTVSAYAKAQYSAFDPGREAIAAQVEIIEKLKEEPERFTEPVDKTYKIAREEFADFQPGRFKEDLIITKTHNNLGVEINYDRTWNHGELGIPIFTEEDSFAKTSLIEVCLDAVGVLPTIAYDGNILISPGGGTLGDEGQLLEDRMSYGVRALVDVMELVCKYAGLW